MSSIYGSAIKHVYVDADYARLHQCRAREVGRILDSIRYFDGMVGNHGGQAKVSMLMWLDNDAIAAVYYEEGTNMVHDYMGVHLNPCRFRVHGKVFVQYKTERIHETGMITFENPLYNYEFFADVIRDLQNCFDGTRIVAAFVI